MMLLLRLWGMLFLCTACATDLIQDNFHRPSIAMANPCIASNQSDFMVALRSAIECGTHCLKEGTCVSFNFFRNNDSCEFHRSQIQIYESRQGCQHYYVSLYYCKTT